jgi:hypothetical protein
MAQKSRASYDYEICQVNEHWIIIIMDLDLAGAMSVTNDIENVVQEIAIKEKTDIKDQLIIYRDSARNWDGWNHKTHDFVFLRTKDLDTAITNIIAYDESKH